MILSRRAVLWASLGGLVSPFTLGGVPGAPAARADPSVRDVLARVETEKQSSLEELQDYLRIPSISTDPDYANDVWRASEFLLDKLRTAGLTAERIETAGHPLIYAEWLGAPGKPTLLFYGH